MTEYCLVTADINIEINFEILSIIYCPVVFRCVASDGIEVEFSFSGFDFSSTWLSTVLDCFRPVLMADSFSILIRFIRIIMLKTCLDYFSLVPRAGRHLMSGTCLVIASSLILVACNNSPIATISGSTEVVPVEPPALADVSEQNFALGTFITPVVIANDGGSVSARGCSVDVSRVNAPTNPTSRLPNGLSLAPVSVSVDGTEKMTCQIVGVPTETTDGAITVAIVGSNANPAGTTSSVDIIINIGEVISTASFSQMSVGTSIYSSSYTCGITNEGYLYCWGEGGSGQLGLGDNINDVPHPRQVDTDSDWQEVSAGGLHTCALKTTGAIFCWGYGYPGQLGQNDAESLTRPTQVSLSTDWAGVSAGLMHTCAINQSGEIFCWGEGGSGQLGLGGSGDRNLPALVGSDADWAQVSAGAAHTCAVKTGGGLYCWGAIEAVSGTNAGQVAVMYSPVQVGTDTDWSSVSSGRGHSCAIKTTGQLHCWGYGGSGQLGQGDEDDQASPAQAGTDTDWAQVSTGVSSTCAVKTGGGLYCWGDAYSDGLGNPVPSGDNPDESVSTVAQANTPTQVGTDTDWQHVQAGEYHVCGLKTTGSIHCWGNGNSGQLGFNDLQGRNAPVAAAAP